MNRVFRQHYLEDVTFRKLMQEIRAELRPIVRQWKPQETADANAALIEEIKFSQAQQQGFDLLYQILTGENPNG